MKLRNKKTGKIGNAIFINADSADYARTIRMRFGGNLYAFRTMKEMIDRFEDYTPAEPCIKDEKILKAVRFKTEALVSTIEQSVKEYIDDIAELYEEEEEC